MKAQRLTTISSRFLMGLSGSFLVHSALERYWLSGFWVHLLTILVGFIFLFLTGHNPKDNSEEEKLKVEEGAWKQNQVIAITIAAIFGGVFVWLN